MKKITIILVIIFTFLFSNTTWGDWSYVVKGSKSQKLYYDKDRIRKSGKFIYFWELLDYLKPTEYGDLSVISYIELDCSIFRYKRLKIQFYNKSMGEGEQTSDMIPQDEWNYPKPNSISEIMYNKICEKFVGEKTEIVVNKKEKGVLYESKVNGELGWYKSGDEKTDWKYEGEVENGKPNGQGTMTSPDGSIYEGKFKDGRQNGQGTMTLIKGGEILGKYVGEFKNDFPNGQGTTTLFSGGGIVGKYVGEHKNNKYHGQGTKTFKDDRKHIGEWKDGKPNGKGKVLYPDGRKINGEYIDGKLDGQGTITYPNGRKFVGEFRKDKPWNVTGYDKDGNILGKYVNGKRIKQ